MKIVVIPILSALVVLAGCSKLNVDHSKDFTHTGCAGTRAALPDDETSLLVLQYEDGNLRTDSVSVNHNYELVCW